MDDLLRLAAKRQPRDPLIDPADAIIRAIGRPIFDRRLTKEDAAMEKRRALIYLGLERDKCVEELGSLEDQRREREKALRRNGRKIEVLEKLPLPPYKFEPAGETKLASAVRALNRDRILRLDADGSAQWVKVRDEVAIGAQSILVQTDWAALIREPEGDVVMPFPTTAFEFTVGGRPVIVFAGDGARTTAYLIDDVWVFGPPWTTPPYELEKMLDAQIRALCIALDAEVAETEVIRAPHSRSVRRGELPEVSHHVVSLTARHRSGTSTGEGRGKRLHFRRGHWRHYETSKTWVRWTLVGDASLGYVEKEYRA